MTPPRWRTPPAVADELGVATSKISKFIASGELVAVNVAASTSTRPRWRISQEALDVFLDGRSSKPVVQAPRRQKRRPAVKEFV